MSNSMWSSLPQDALYQIISHLPSPSRDTFITSNPYLTKTCSPSNHQLWNYVNYLRYPNFHPNLVPFPDPYRQVLLCDAALDYFLVSTPTFNTIHIPPDVTSNHTNQSHHPIISNTSTTLHIAHRSKYTQYPFPLSSSKTIKDTSITLDGNATSISTSSNAIAIGLSNGAIHLQTPRSIQSRLLRGHRGAILSLALSGSTIISGGTDRVIRLRSIHSRRTLFQLRGHDSCIEWLYTPPSNPHWLYSHAGNDGRIKLWDINIGRCISTARLSSPIISAVASSPTGEVVYGATSKNVALLDIREGLDRTSALLTRPSAQRWAHTRITTLSLANDGTLAAGLGASAVVLWDATGRWEGRGLGWPARFVTDTTRRLKTVYIGNRSVFAGGATSELLVLAQDGVVGEIFGPSSMNSIYKARITDIRTNEENKGVIVVRENGVVEDVHVDAEKVDWEKAEGVVRTQLGEEDNGFWNTY